MRIWAISILILLPALTVQAAQSLDSTFERIANTGLFAFGGVGLAGQISEGEEDFVAILSRPSAMADLERLFVAGNRQAKAYALVGIHMLDENRFEELSRSLRSLQDRVLTARGCIVSRETMDAVLKQIEAGAYRSRRAASAGTVPRR